MTLDSICLILPFLIGIAFLINMLINIIPVYRKAKQSGILKFHLRHGRFYYILCAVGIFCEMIVIVSYLKTNDLWHIISCIGYILMITACAVSAMGYITNDGWYGILDKHPQKIVSKTGNHELWFYFAGNKNNDLFLHIPDTPQNRQKFRNLLIRKEEVL